MAGIPDTKFLTLPEPTFPQPPRKVTGTHVLHMVHPPPVPRVGLMTSHTNITLYASKQKVSDPNRDSSFGSNNKKTQNQAGSILGVFCSYNLQWYPCNSWQHHLSTPWKKNVQLDEFCQWQLDLKSYQKLGKCLGYFRCFGVESALF